MSERELLIIKAILTFLDWLDGGQAVEPLIHAAAQTALRNQGESAPSLAELRACVVTCDQRGWVTGVAAKVTRQMKWSLSDEGKAALLELA
jgi:hypothetical protein